MLETQFLKTAQDAARIAGNVLQMWAEKFTVSEKSPANLVTEADYASQEAIHKAILEQYPEHNFLGEEELIVSRPESAFRWIIDPLDGTSNYVHHFPYYAVSIALESDEGLLVGVIFDPNRDEMFSAIRGRGATLNGTKISTSKVRHLNQAMVVASLPVGVRREHPAVDQFLRVMPHVQSVQRTGSAALNLSYVAAGRIDAFWSLSLKPWDVAAGALLVEEAGGQVTRQGGSPLDIEIPDILSSNGSEIHERLQELLS